jgi:superfamily II DNA or RNA helicase
VVVLHGTWWKDALHLWAERWPAEAAATHANNHAVDKNLPPFSPYDADVKTLADALASISDVVVTDRKPMVATAWLPTEDGRLVHSRETWQHAPGTGAQHAAKKNKESKENPLFTVQPWRVTTLPLPRDAQFALLGACSEDRRPASGVVAGTDLLMWAELFRYAGALVARQAFLPAMVPAGAQYESRWQPAFDGAERHRLFAFAARLPGAARCLAEAGAPVTTTPAASVAEAFVSATVDGLVRRAVVTTLSRAHASKGRFFSAHDAWLASLRGDSSLVRWPQVNDLASLAEEIDLWRRPVDLASRALWRLALRLEEPVAAGNGRWLLRYLVQPFANPEAVKPLSSVWQHGAVASAACGEPALMALGQAAALCPLIGRGLTAQQTEGCELTTGEAYEFLTRHMPLLEAAGFGVLTPAWWQAADRRPHIELIARVASDNKHECSLSSLVSVNWEIALGGEPVTVEELENLAKSGEKLVNFRGRWIEVDGKQVTEAVRLWRKQRAEERAAGDIVRMMIGVDQDAHGIRLGGVTAKGWIEKLIRNLRGDEALEELPPPAGFVGELRPYQLRGFAWLAYLRGWGLGACLADDMGLGKTIQALAFMARERERGEKRPVLLVCPTTVLGNWQREAAKFTPGLAVLCHHGPDRGLGDLFAEEAKNYALVVTSYALLPRDYATLRRVSWAGVILDEAQNIKNPDTRQSQAARALTADYRFALTGTPVENHVGDLWSIMDFLNPGLLGARAAFRERFLRPIQAGVDPAARERLRRATTPFILRRLKTDRTVISDLPEKTENKVFCPLTREQAAMYAVVLADLSNALVGAEGIKRRGLVLATLTRLKQICNHPENYTKSGGELANRSGKLERIGAMLDEVVSSGDHALVFTQFAEMGALLQQHIGQQFGFEPPFLHGGVPAHERDRMVAAFQAAGGPPVFVLSLRAGGTGLNLTRANHVFHFDRWWNPAVENQATDRAFRIGQTRDVMVHKLICAGTLEDRIDAMITAKTAVADDVIGSGEAWLTKLSDEELKATLELAPGAVADDDDEPVARKPARADAARRMREEWS